MLQKDQEEVHAPRQSGSFKALQDFIDSDGEIGRRSLDRRAAHASVSLPSWTGTRPIGTRTVKAPTLKQAPPTGNLQKLPICDKCGNGIV